MKTVTGLGLAGLLAALIFNPGGALQAQRRSPDGFITGTVRGSAGPQAGVLCGL